MNFFKKNLVEVSMGYSVVNFYGLTFGVEELFKGTGNLFEGMTHIAKYWIVEDTEDHRDEYILEQNGKKTGLTVFITADYNDFHYHIGKKLDFYKGNTEDMLKDLLKNKEKLDNELKEFCQINSIKYEDPFLQNCIEYTGGGH